MPISPLVSIPLTLAAGAASVAAGWVSLYQYYPAIPAFIYGLIAYHPVLTGIWLALSVVGIDASMVALCDGVSYGNVGSKARAYYSLSQGGR